MSVIKLKCIGQILTIVNSPEIASGNVNFDHVNFTFCETWSGFGKTAIFYRNREEVYYQVLDENDTCIIPKEVLASKGIFYIGVFGSKDNVVLTSNVVSYRVNEGAITDNLTPPDPSLDIYEQILAQFGDVQMLYDELKDSIDKIDETGERVTDLENAIVKSNELEYPGSKAGGLKFNRLVGSTTQSAIPGAINNTGDSVDMIQGVYNSSTGVWTANTGYICSKNLIPCASGDVIDVTIDGVKDGVMISCFNENGYSRYLWTESSENEFSFTIPTGVTKFGLNVRKVGGITTDTVGKISLTINGKSVLLFKEHGKNHLPYPYYATTLTSNGITFTDNGDGTITVSGTSTNSSYFNLDFTHSDLTVGESYILSISDISTGVRGVFAYFNTSNNAVELCNTTTSATFTVPTDYSKNRAYIYVQSGVTVNTTVYPMIRKADTEDATYEPYKEKIARVLLDAPLTVADVMTRSEVVRKRGTVVLNGSENWAYWGTEGDNYGVTLDNAFTYNNSLSNTTNALSNMFVPMSGGRLPEECLGLRQNGDTQYRVYLCLATSRLSEASVNGVKEWLAENPITLEYELATPIVETLDPDSKIALNSLETFDGVTYLEIDSRTAPTEIETEYGVTQASAYALEGLLKADRNDAKISELTTALLALNQE